MPPYEPHNAFENRACSGVSTRNPKLLEERTVDIGTEGRANPPPSPFARLSYKLRAEESLEGARDPADGTEGKP
jgi:hypothetical protein